MSQIDTFVAATTATIHQTWYDYVRYLEAQLLLLRMDDDGALAFEQAADDGNAETTARATLAAIPPQRRACFEAVVEQARQRMLRDAEAALREGKIRGPLDPTCIEQDTLQHLLDQAHGRGTPTPGRGWVPLSPEQNDWYEVDVQALQDAPHASAYLLRSVEQDDRRRSYRQAALVVVVMVLALVGWWLWPRAAAPARVVDSAPLVDGVAVAPWPLQQLVLTTLTSTVTLPISTTTSASWPAHATDTPPLAFWRAPVLLPLALCVPQHLLADATRVELHSTPDVPRRVYTLGDSGIGTPDLLLEACDAQGDTPLAARWGVLDAVVLPPDKAIGQAVSVSDAVLTVEDIHQYGSGEDPTLPPDTMRVEVTVVTTASLSWSRLAPTLLLHDGQALSASSTTATADGAVLHYLVPSSHEPRPVVWQLSLPPGVGLQRWRAELSPPRIRSTVLREALHIEQIAVSDQTADTVTLELSLRNTGDTALVLTAADLVVTQDERPLALPELAALHTPLEGGEQRRLTLALLLPADDDTLVVALGPFRYAVRY